MQTTATSEADVCTSHYNPPVPAGGGGGTTRLPKQATAIQGTPLLRTSGDFSSVFCGDQSRLFSTGKWNHIYL